LQADGGEEFREGALMFVRVDNSNKYVVKPKGSAPAAGPRSARRPVALRAIGAAAFVIAVSASSGAWAQNCGALTPTGVIVPGGDWKSAFGAGIAGASAAAATISATNTAFLTHSAAFVSAPPNAPPDSQGGGVWARVVGGDETIKSNGPTSYNFVAPGVLTNSGSTTCNSSFKQNFFGVQAGTDVSKLNINGWNIHLGTTIGYLESRGDIEEGATPFAGAFDTDTKAPFIGTYAAATYGGFFAEGLLRFNYYETNLNSPSVNIYNQKLDAHGISLSGSAGYHYAIPNSDWFIEPSAGAVWSRTKVDPLQLAGAGTVAFPGHFQGTVQIDDIESFIGRAGLRVGTTFVSGNMLWQPFAAASIWHEFEGGWSANYTSCSNCLFLGAVPSQLTASMSGSGIGTYGVYSLGIAGQVVNTGWLGYARIDFEDGSDIRGWTASGGLRYQFTPEAPHHLIAKAPVPAVRPVVWNGFYIGGFGGVTSGGKADVNFDPAPATANTLAFAGASGDPQLAGLLGGGDVGYNYQMGQWVLGLEGDIAWTNTRGSKACGTFSAALALPTNALFNMTCHDQLSWLATTTARVGYAWDRALYYVKAGGAFTHEEFSVTCNLGGGLNVAGPQSCYDPKGTLVNSISASSDRFGWTAGFGVEFALTDSWSAKAETDYIAFGNKSYSSPDGTTFSTKLDVWETKVGVNYRFASM
jgi:opacity protein-like surface antigen